MADVKDPLVLDLVEWIARAPRLYSEVIESWRTSCPRLTIWEDAVDRGYVAREAVAGAGTIVRSPRTVKNSCATTAASSLLPQGEKGRKPRITFARLRANTIDFIRSFWRHSCIRIHFAMQAHLIAAGNAP